MKYFLGAFLGMLLMVAFVYIIQCVFPLGRDASVGVLDLYFVIGIPAATAILYRKLDKIHDEVKNKNQDELK